MAEEEKNEVLSQGEINQLLTAIAAGSADDTSADVTTPSDPRRIRIYDFKRPPILTRAHKDRLAAAVQSFAVGAMELLSARLRTPALFHLASLDELTYQEFINSVPNPSAFLRFSDRHAGAVGAVEIDPAIFYAMVGTALGGAPIGGRIRRPATRIEQSVVRWLIRPAIDVFGDSVGRTLGFVPTVESLATDPAALGLAPAGQMVVLATLEAKVGDTEGMINMCLPHALLRSYARRAPHELYPGMPADEDSELHVDAERLELPVATRVAFDLPEMTIDDLAKLQPGDRIACARLANEPLLLRAAEAEVAQLKVTGEQIVVTERAHRPSVPLRTAVGTERLERVVTRRLEQIEQRLLDRIDQLATAREVDEEASDMGARFARLRAVGVEAFAQALAGEHPQTIAAAVSMLEPKAAAGVLALLPPEVAAGVAARAAVLGRVDRAVFGIIAGGIEDALSNSRAQFQLTSGGVEWVAQMLKAGDVSMERNVLENLSEADPELCAAIEEHSFTFADIVGISDRHLQRVLREVDTRDLAFAMRGADELVSQKVYSNMSKRAAELLKEEIEFMGPIRRVDAHEAQKRIIRIVRTLERQGEIVIGDSGEVL